MADLSNVRKIRFYVKTDRVTEKIALSASDFLEGKGIKVFMEDRAKKRKAFSHLSSDKRKEADMAMSFGGDGTLLSSIAAMGDRQIPLLGVSCGQRGFLTQSSMDQLEHDIQHILTGRVEVIERSRFTASIDGKPVRPCLNEYAVVSKTPVSVMKYTIKVNGATLWDEDGDGVIIATPTGSTGYAESAGGVTILSGSNVIEVVPISPLNKRSRPLVVPSHSVVEISNILSKKGSVLVVDGWERVDLNDRSVTITLAKTPALLLKRTDVHEHASQRYLTEPEGQAITRLPASAKFVFKIIETKGSMTSKELEKETMLPARTLRKALQDLVKVEIVGKRQFWNDPRKSFYFLRVRAR